MREFELIPFYEKDAINPRIWSIIENNSIIKKLQKQYDSQLFGVQLFVKECMYYQHQLVYANKVADSITSHFDTYEASNEYRTKLRDWLYESKNYAIREIPDEIVQNKIRGSKFKILCQ